MKRIIAVLLCMLFVFAMPLVAYAEEATDPSTGTEAVVPDEGLTTDKIMGYIKENIEEISVIITMIIMTLYQAIKHRLLNKSIGTLNNNSIAVTEKSNEAIGDALTSVSLASAAVVGFKSEIANLLAEVRANEEEKQKLADTLASVEKYLATAKATNLELANEVAELLALANIPNSKKEELYSRHRAAVDAIIALDGGE